MPTALFWALVFGQIKIEILVTLPSGCYIPCPAPPMYWVVTWRPRPWFCFVGTKIYSPSSPSSGSFASFLWNCFPWFVSSIFFFFLPTYFLESPFNTCHIPAFHNLFCCGVIQMICVPWFVVAVSVHDQFCCLLFPGLLEFLVYPHWPSSPKLNHVWILLWLMSNKSLKWGLLIMLVAMTLYNMFAHLNTSGQKIFFVFLFNPACCIMALSISFKTAMQHLATPLYWGVLGAVYMSSIPFLLPILLICFTIYPALLHLSFFI